MLIGASSSRRLGWLRKTSLALVQSCRISGSISWIFLPLFFFPCNNLSMKPSNPSMPKNHTPRIYDIKLNHLFLRCKISVFIATNLEGHVVSPILDQNDTKDYDKIEKLDTETQELCKAMDVIEGKTIVT